MTYSRLFSFGIVASCIKWSDRLRLGAAPYDSMFAHRRSLQVPYLSRGWLCNTFQGNALMLAAHRGLWHRPLSMGGDFSRGQKWPLRPISKPAP